MVDDAVGRGGEERDGEGEGAGEEGDGTSFWRKFSQAGQKDLGDKRGDDLDDGEEEKAEPLRKVLQKKRSSLSHKPDIVRMFEKENDKAQQEPHVPEFFKVTQF